MKKKQIYATSPVYSYSTKSVVYYCWESRLLLYMLEVFFFFFKENIHILVYCWQYCLFNFY